MPEKLAHDATCIVIALQTLTQYERIGWTLPEATVFALGAASGIILSPDLDVVERRRPTPWNLYWYPYGWLFEHRHPLTHAPVVSTLLRLAYLMPIFFPVVMLINKLGLFNREYFFLWLAGLVLADIVHWVMDEATTWFKRQKRRL